MWHALPVPDPACLLSLTVLATLHCYAATRTAALLQMSFIDHERINVAKSNFPEGYMYKQHLSSKKMDSKFFGAK